MITPEQQFKKQTLLGRVYFLALIPFIGAVLAPWVLGPQASSPSTAFTVWSFSVLLFILAANVGYAHGRAEKTVYAHALVALVLAAIGIGSVLLQTAAGSALAPVALLTLLHWLTWLWLQKSRTLEADLYKQHKRFVWTALACHMLVLLNVVYGLRTVT